MAAIEFLDQESAANPGERGNRPDGCNQEFHSDQDPQHLAVRCDKSRQRRNAEHIDLDIDKLQQESLPERSRSLLCTDLRPADRNVNRKPEDVRSANILHDRQGMGKELAHAVHEDGTDELDRIVSREYPEKERLPLPPSVISHGIQCQYVCIVLSYAHPRAYFFKAFT